MRSGTSKEKMLQEAIEAGQSGDLPHARGLLYKLLRRDNHDSLYWLLMSTAVESREERIYCLHNVLFLDSENSAAKHDLELLGAEIPRVKVPTVKPADRKGWQTADIATPRVSKKRKQKVEQSSLTWILGVLAIGAAVILFGYYIAETALFDFILMVNETPTPFAVGSPTATISVASEISMAGPEQLLSATYTATPRYVNTPHPEEALFQQGLDALDDEDWERAAQAFSPYLAANPDAVDAAYFLGEALMASGNLADAGEAFMQALSISTQFAPAYFGRARLGTTQGADPATILTDLNTAILLDSAFVDAYIERATYYLVNGLLPQSLEDLTLAERLAPNSALVQYHKARLYLLEEDFANALQASQRAYEIDLTLLPNYVILAQAQQELGQYAEAIEVVQIYLTFEGGDGFGWELLGVGYELNGQHELALEAFDRALSIDPSLAQAAYYRGLEALDVGINEMAIPFFQTAVSSRPDWFEARLALSQVYLEINRPSTAFFELNASSSLAESDSQRAAFFFWRATILEALDQNENALADWRSLLALPPSGVPQEWRQAAQARVEAAQ